jgi:hypothetical protein
MINNISDYLNNINYILTTNVMMFLVLEGDMLGVERQLFFR